ncbi:hypothetical protein FRC07_013868 [Ceratobasidium sp. 392]|nr:hypothetical protein FRC07_013868 [Ceratobasidium sp. 392]
MQRIRSQPARHNYTAKRDPVFFISTEGKTAHTAKLHDCSVGQVQLIFRLNPTLLVPNPPLLVYLRSFSKIPESSCRVTGLKTVKKFEGRKRHVLVPATDIVRLCPLAPVIDGRGPGDINRDEVYDRFSTFYLNKYRNIDDFIFMFSDCL